MNQEFENNNVENNENIEQVEETEVTEVQAEPEAQENANVAEAAETKKKKGWKRELLEWVESLGIAVVAALLIVNFVFSMVWVSGVSMEPTLQNKDFLFVFKLGYTPKNSDVVVLKPKGEPDKYYIKRVIATEGQTVDIVNGEVYVDDKPLEEDYIQGITEATVTANPMKFPQTVPEDCVFVLGDNREHSRDSRDSIGVGMVEENRIAGKALFRIFPFNKIGKID